MKYISDDGKIFNTEQECLDYEDFNKQRFEAERQKLLDTIDSEYRSLQKNIREYERKYGCKQTVNFIPFYEIAEMLCV